MSKPREKTEMYLNAAPVVANPDSISLEKWLLAALALAVAGVFLVGGWIQQQVHLNHDVGWIVHSAGWLLEGRRFGSDILDPNPPLIWFVSLPAAALARMGWLAEPEAIRLYLWLLCLGSLALCHHVLAPLRRAGKQLEAAAIVFGIAFACAVLSGRSFGQREFLAFVLGMPYCLLIAGRIEYGTRYSRVVSIACGLIGGVAFGLKPWLVAVPVLLEIVYWTDSRQWRQVFRGETLALAGFLVAYVLAALAFTPDYFTVALPLVRAVYWVYGRSDALKMWEPLRDALAPLAACMFMLVMGRSFFAYPRVLLAAVVGYSLNYWMQHKGFEYHLYPVMATSIVLLIYAFVPACRGIMAAKWLRGWIRFAVVGTVLLILFLLMSEPTQEVRYWLARDNIATGTLGQLRQALIVRVRELTRDGRKRIYAFSTHPYPGFPTMSYVHAEWSGAQLAQFAFSAYMKKDRIEDPMALERIDWGVSRQRQLVITEFLAHDPEIVLVNTRAPKPVPGGPAFDFVAFLGTDQRFAERWRSYHEVKRSGAIRVFVRNK